jgi:tRNA nucleotidyltransferase (CCA-adding enzyme)
LKEKQALKGVTAMNASRAFLEEMFNDAGRDRVFLVGGTVRDELLGRSGRDIDLAAALTAAELASLGFHQVKGKSTAPIWFRYEKAFGKIEITPLADIDELHANLAGRDFTINALAMTLSGEVIDPLDGRTDLGQRALRACSPGSFLDDPLRIFRAFRFEADGWRATEETDALIREREWSRQLAHIPVERFSREMLKALESRDPERFFLRMGEFRVGDNYLPEIFRMPHIPAGPLIHHPEGDLFSHSIQVLQRVARQSNDPLTRFCAFFHDIGKLATDPAVYPGHHGHDKAGFDMAHPLCQRLRLPAEYRTALAWTSRLHSNFNKWAELRDSTKVRTAEMAAKAGIADILPLVAMGDKGKDIDTRGWNCAVRVVRMRAAELGIEQSLLDGVPEEKRPDFFLQKRVEMLRGLLSPTPTSSP